ncbi:MAG: hypothetical protein IKZ53_09565 [Selenomonadaceae bacterium]|nr:hypothetical protein [Selenomonadaceae bacterium]
MRAFHTLRTKNKLDFALVDFEIFTLILSVLEWQKHNGKIFLYTDTTGKNYLANAGLLNLWDGADTSLDEMDSLGIDENIFWAGAKLHALSKQPLPCVMIDLDFIVWQPLNFEQLDSKLAVIHRESCDLLCYPDENYFRFKNFSLPADLDWSVNPCNAALVYFGDKNFVRRYVEFAFEFMKAANPLPEQKGWDLLPYMVFVEQRWMAMCAELCNVEIKSLSHLTELFGGEQKTFTHIWGHKQLFRDNKSAEEKFCRDCAGRIAHDFPEVAEIFSQLALTKKYFAS